MEEDDDRSIDRCTPAGEGNEGNASHSHTVDPLANQRIIQLQSSHGNSSSMLVADVLSTLAAVCHGGPASRRGEVAFVLLTSQQVVPGHRT